MLQEIAYRSHEPVPSRLPKMAPDEVLHTCAPGRIRIGRIRVDSGHRGSQPGLPRLTQPEPTSGRASLHRYSPGGEYDGNEYGGLPVNCSVFDIMLRGNVFHDAAMCR